METEHVYPRVTFKRDFPSGCGKFMSISSPLKRFRTCIRDFPPGCGPNAPKITQFSQEKREKSNPNDTFNCTKPPLYPKIRPLGCGSKLLVKKPLKVPRVKFVDGMVNSENLEGKKDLGGKMMVKIPLKVPKVKLMDDMVNGKSFEGKKDLDGCNSSEGKSKVREKVLEMLLLFRRRCDELSKKGVKRIDIVANRELSSEGKVMKQPSLMFGSIPGVEVGDKFYYRIELVIVGLHRLFQGGIDSMEYGMERYATCIVANEGHLDKMGDPNVLSYIGEGGTLKRHEVGIPPDQQLSGGNLALNNSRKSKRPVRVVRGLRYGSANSKIVYVYDGLYEVVETLKKRGPQKNMVFEFKMVRNSGQHVVSWKDYRRMFA